MNARTHLLLAIKSNHHQAISRLMKEVDPSEEIENKKTPIELACDLNHWDCVNAIAKNKKTDSADKARYGYVLWNAVKNGNLNSAKILLEAGTPDTSDHTYFHAAVKERNCAMIVLLQQFNFNFSAENIEKKTPLLLAIELGYDDCVEVINAKYDNALLQAVEHGRVDAARIFLEAGASRACFNKKGDSLLHIAVKKHSIEMIKLLLSFNVNLTLENSKKETPIQLACRLHRWDFIDEIAKLRQTDSKDNAKYAWALLEAVHQKRLNSARILLEAGASKKAIFMETGDNCLRRAIRNSDKSMITLLLSFGFRLDAVNKKNQNALQFADSVGIDYALHEGWKKYFNEETLKISNTLTLFAQAKRQSTSTLYNIPSSLLEYMLTFLSPEVAKHTDTLHNKVNTLAKISTNCFLNDDTTKLVPIAVDNKKKSDQMKLPLKRKF